MALFMLVWDICRFKKPPNLWVAWIGWDALASNQEELCLLCRQRLAPHETNHHNDCWVIAEARRHIADARSRIRRSQVLMEASRALLERPAPN